MKRESNTLWIVTNRHIICDGRSNKISNQIFTEFYSDLPDEKRPRYPAMVEKYTPFKLTPNNQYFLFNYQERSFYLQHNPQWF